MANAPDPICIIVVSYNTKRFWARQKTALDAQTHQNWFLIIVDNASAPEERLAPHEISERATLIQLEANIGFAAANNLAARRADAGLLALLNPDAFPEPDWLAQLAAASRRWPEAAAFGSRQLLADNSALLDGDGDEMFVLGFPYRGGFHKPVPAAQNEGPCFSACAAAALYRREDFLDAGGFDERFFSYCEDVDLGYRLRLRRRISVQIPSAVVHHVGGASAARTSEFAKFHGRRNRIWVLVKNAPPILLWAILLPHMLITMAGLAKETALGRGGAAWRGFTSAFADAGSLLARRRAVQRRRWASSWSIARCMIWNPFAVAARGSKRHGLKRIRTIWTDARDASG